MTDHVAPNPGQYWPLKSSATPSALLPISHPVRVMELIRGPWQAWVRPAYYPGRDDMPSTVFGTYRISGNESMVAVNGLPEYDKP